MICLKKIVSLTLALAMCTSMATTVFESGQSQIEPAAPKDGFVIDQTFYNTLEYNGDGAMTRIPTMLSSGVSRYRNHSNSEWYAKGATTVVESTTGNHLEHYTTVQLEKRSFWGTTVLVTKTETGTVEVWAETGTTPTKVDSRVYWDI